MVSGSIERIGALGLAPRDVLQALLASIPDAVYVVDHEGRVAFANPAALELLGYEESELLGQISHPTIHHHHWDGTPFPEEQCPMLRPRVTGETVRVDDDCFWRHDGSKFRVAYSSAPLAISGERGAIVVFRDATERIEAERAAVRVNTATPDTAVVRLTGIDAGNWPAVVEAASLSGMVRQFALNCVPAKFEHDVLTLQIDEATADRRTRPIEDKFQQALSKYLGRNIRVAFEIARATLATPARQRTLDEQDKVLRAAAAFEADPAVKGLRERFGADIDAASVKPAN